MDWSWWCSSTGERWTWGWRPYPGVWLVMIGLVVGYVLVVRRSTQPTRRTLLFVGGVGVLWVALDWPLGPLGSGYLLSAHSLQYVLSTMVAAPLLVLGAPDRIVDRWSPRRPLVVGAVAYNVVMVATHVPAVLDALRSSQAGSFVMDAAWVTSGILLWLPVCRSRLPYPQRIGYLFVSTLVVGMGTSLYLMGQALPLYRTYELAPRVAGYTARSDQRMAGLVMGIGHFPSVGGAIAGMMTRWAFPD